MEPLVLPEYRPTLGELTAAWPRGLRAALLAVVVLILALAVYAAVRPSDDGVHVVRERPVAFNLRHAPGLREVPPHAGELLRLEQRSGGEPGTSFVIRPLSLPAYHGDVAGTLPIAADSELGALRRGAPGLELVQEGKARLNQVAGYTMAYRLSRSPRRYGRELLLPEPAPGSRTGVRITMEAPPGGGVANAEDVGAGGVLKLPYRSFRFGTRGP